MLHKQDGDDAQAGSINGTSLYYHQSILPIEKLMGSGTSTLNSSAAYLIYLGWRIFMIGGLLFPRLL
jgi:hypothetical protein